MSVKGKTKFKEHSIGIPQQVNGLLNGDGGTTRL